jgi:menaquinone-dependent protoporphyrinogen oxidase
MPAARTLFPEGDFRNWNDIDAWATGIARALALSFFSFFKHICRV